MASDIAYLQVSTEEDLRIELDFGSSFDLAGKTLRVEVRERASATLKTTLTVGSGLTVTLPGKVVAYVAKAFLAGWTRGEYTADLIDTSASMQRRIVPVRFLYDEPGKLPGGVKGNSATVMVGNNQAVVTAVRGETGPIGATGPANTLTIGTVTNLPPGSTPSAEITGTAPNQVLNLSVVRGLDGIGGPTDQGYQALLRQMELEAALARLPTPVTELPSLNLDFLFDTYFARRAAISAALPAFISAMAGSFTRASAAWYFDATGTLVQAAVNVPRLDHDPVMLARLGYLAEGARANGIRRSVPTGHVVGAPGTAPTNWMISHNSTIGGISREIVGSGQEDGIDYLDVRFFGTSTGAGFATIEADTRTAVVASVGQTWSFSQFSRVVAGSFAGVSAATLYVFEFDGAGAQTGGATGVAATITSAPLRMQRPSATRTLSDASVARLMGQFRLSWASGATIDVTVRVGLPQLEQGAFATSPIKTTGSAVTRAAEGFALPFVATGGTVLVVAREQGDTAYGRYVQMDTGSDANYLTVCRGNANGGVLLSGAGTNSGTAVATGAVGRKAIAARIGAAGGIRVNGGSVATAAMTVGGTTHLRVGNQADGNNLFGWIERVIVWPGVQMTDAQLLSLSTLSNWG